MRGESAALKMDPPRSDAENAFDHILKIGGHVDFRQVDEKEYVKFWFWYNENFDRLNAEDQTEYLEQFIVTGVADDSSALKFVRSFDNDHKYAIGEFLVKVAETEKYVQTFYECFESFSNETQSELVKKYSLDEPKNAILIAPFVTLSSLYEKPQKKDVPPRTLLNRFDHYDSANDLISNLIEFYRRKPSAEVSDRIRALFIDYFYPSILSKEVTGAKTLLRNDFCILHIAPFIEELVELKIFSKEELLRLIDNDSFYLDRSYVMRTKEGAEEMRKIEDDVRRANKFFDHYYGDLLENEVVSLGREARNRYFRQKREGELNTAHAAVKLFAYFKDDFSRSRRQTFENFVEMSPPGIWASVSESGLSKEEVLKTLSNTENYKLRENPYLQTKELLRFARKEGDTEIEKFLVELYVEGLVGGFWLELEEDTVGNFLELFLPDNRKLILDAFVESSPVLLLTHVKFCKEKGIDMVDLIRRSDKGSLMEKYPLLLDYFSKSGEEALVKQLNRTAKGIAKSDINMLLTYQKPAVKLLNVDEIRSFIEAGLKHPGHETVYNILYSMFYDKFKPEIASAVRNDPEVIVELSRLGSCSRLRELFSVKEFHSLMLRTKGRIDLRSIYQDDEYIIESAKEPASISALVRNLEPKSDSLSIAFVVSTFSHVLKYESKVGLLDEKIRRLDDLKSEATHYGGLVNKDIIRKSEEEIKTLNKYNGVDFQALGAMIPLAKESMLRICEKEPGSIVNADIIEILGMDAAPLLKRDFRMAVKRSPQKIIETGKQSFQLVYRDVLGEKEFDQIFRENLNALSVEIMKGRRPSSIPFEIEEELEMANPLYSAEKRIFSRNNVDLEGFTKLLAGLPFYEFFRNDLESVIKREIEAGGNDFFHIIHNPEFAEIVDKLVLLKNSRVNVSRPEMVLSSYDGSQPSEFLDRLVFAAYYNLDDFTDDELEEGVEKLDEKLQKRIGGFLSEYFEIEIRDMGDLSYSDLMALKRYYDDACADVPEMKSSFQKFMTEVCSGNYLHWRTWGDATDAVEGLNGLKKEELLPKGITLEQYKAWIETEETELEETLDIELDDLKDEISNILSHAEGDRHIPEGLLDETPENLKNRNSDLFQRLAKVTKRRNELEVILRKTRKTGEKPSEILESEHETLKNEIADLVERNKSLLERTKALRLVERLRHLTKRDLLSRGLFTSETNLVPFEKIFDTLNSAFADYPNFVGDIARLRALVANAQGESKDGRASKTKLKITDKIDLPVYLRIGEEPVQSCQSYKSTGKMNGGLLSYMTDPNVKIIQVFNEKGIIARSVMRMLESESGEPVIFFERIYSSSPHRKIQTAIEDFARQKAGRMKVKCVSEEKRGGKNKYFNKASRSLYVYSDAGGGLKKYGIFSV